MASSASASWSDFKRETWRSIETPDEKADFLSAYLGEALRGAVELVHLSDGEEAEEMYARLQEEFASAIPEEFQD